MGHSATGPARTTSRLTGRAGPCRPVRTCLGCSRSTSAIRSSRGGVDPGGGDDERAGQAVPHRACGVHRHRGAVRDPDGGLPHDDGLHAGVGRPVPPVDAPRQPDGVRGDVRAHLLLRQLRAQRHDLHRTCGNLPGATPRDVPRHLGGVGQGGCHHRVLRVPVPGAEPGPGQDDARVRVGHRRAQLAAAVGRVHLPRVPAHVPGAGAQGQVARGDVARDGEVSRCEDRMECVEETACVEVVRA
jgi:hypothetical protein